MKPDELMINDMVYDENNAPHQIKELGTTFSIDKNLVLLYTKILKPIPLTAEILEKNGVTLLEVGDNGIATPKSQRNRYEKWFIHTKFVDTYLWYDRLSSRWHLHNMSGAKFKYVHELQHALRLCKLTDFADNFKV